MHLFVTNVDYKNLDTIDQIDFITRRLINWFYFPEISIRMLFFILVSLALHIFEELENRIELLFSKFSYRPNTKMTHDFSEQLEEWRHQYDLVCRFVDQINKSFGLIILIILAYSVAVSIATFYKSITVYSYIVQIFLTFDAEEMIKNLNSTAASLNLDPILDNEVIDMIKICYTSLETMVSVTNSWKNFDQLLTLFHQSVKLWFRLLIVLVPSYRMAKKVRANFRINRGCCIFFH